MTTQPQHNGLYNSFSVLALTCSLLFTSMAQAATHKADFNGDGYGDLLVGVPYEDVNGKTVAGAVSVVYGSRNGLGAEPSQTLHLDTPGNGEQDALPNNARVYDKFGYSVAVGDFDLDGIDDAAIGIPYKDYLGKYDVGLVTILYGSRAYGLHGPRNEYIGIGLFNNKAQNQTNFGSALAVGDINGDHYDDLAIGIPGYDVNSSTQGPIKDAGAIAVFFGSANGLRNSSMGPHFIIQALDAGHRDSEGPAYVKGRSERDDRMGSVLKLADFHNDGKADLIIGIPNEDIEGSTVKTDAGGVAVLRGTPSGLTGSQFFIRDHEIKDGDHFGSSLATGDFNGNYSLDLAIGAPDEDVYGKKDAGVVTVIYGGREGLNVNNRQFWHQNRPAVSGKVEEDDHFGYALTAGDFDNDGRDDLAVGVPYEDHNKTLWFNHYNTGLVSIFKGGSQGLFPYATFHQDSEGIAGKREMYDYFGNALSVNDFNNDGKADLAIGVFEEDVRVHDGTVYNAGIVQTLYGNTSQLLAPGQTQIISQSLSPHAVGERRAELGDHFGGSLP